MHACVCGYRDGWLVLDHCQLRVIAITAWGGVCRQLPQPRREVCWERLVMSAVELGKKGG